VGLGLGLLAGGGVLMASESFPGLGGLLVGEEAGGEEEEEEEEVVLASSGRCWLRRTNWAVLTPPTGVSGRRRLSQQVLDS
jgi:hypothetical protein